MQILDEDKHQVAEADGTSVKMTIKNVHLWQPLDAYLYTLQVNLIKHNQIVDTYLEPFGVRTVEVKNAQFLINNQPFYFKGFGKHEDTYVNGRGLNNAYNVIDINLIKQMGANSIRTSHYPYSEEMMRLCDREGIVVIDEVPAVGLIEGFNINVSDLEHLSKDNTWFVMQTSEAHEQAICELIARDKNHTCVVMWSIANEAANYAPAAHDHFIGEQVWNFADFQTKFGVQRVQGNKKGLFTRAREPKQAASYLKQRWLNIPNFNYKIHQPF